MYGILDIKGHQYKVQVGDIFDVEKLDGDVGAELNFDKVLFVGGEKALVGAPAVNCAKVKAKIVKQDRDRKLIVFKRRPGLWKKIRGHRQYYTGLLITEIEDGQGNTIKIDKKSKQAEKYLK